MKGMDLEIGSCNDCYLDCKKGYKFMYKFIGTSGNYVTKHGDKIHKDEIDCQIHEKTTKQVDELMKNK